MTKEELMSAITGLPAETQIYIALLRYTKEI